MTTNKANDILDKILNNLKPFNSQTLHFIHEKSEEELKELIGILKSMRFKDIKLYKGFREFFYTIDETTLSKDDIVLSVVNSGKGFTHKILTPAFCREFNLDTFNSNERVLHYCSDKLSLYIMLNHYNVSQPRLIEEILPSEEDTLIIPKPKDAEYSKGIHISNIKPLKEIKEISMNYIYQEVIKGKEYEIPLMVVDNQIVKLPIRCPRTKSNELGILDEKIVAEDNYTLDFIQPIGDEFDFLYEEAMKVYKAIDADTFLRVDFRLDENNKPYVIDISTSLSFDKDNIFIEAFKLLGYSYEEAVKLRLYKPYHNISDR